MLLDLLSSFSDLAIPALFVLLAWLFPYARKLKAHLDHGGERSVRGFLEADVSLLEHALLSPLEALEATPQTNSRFPVPGVTGLEVFVSTHEFTERISKDQTLTTLWFMTAFYFDLAPLPDNLSLSTHPLGERYIPSPLTAEPPHTPHPTTLLIHDGDAPGEHTITARTEHALALLLSDNASTTPSRLAKSIVEIDFSTAECDLAQLHRHSDQLVLVYRGCVLADATTRRAKSAMRAVIEHARSMRRELAGWADGSSLIDHTIALMNATKSPGTRKMCAEIAMTQQRLADAPDDPRLAIVEAHILEHMNDLDIAEFAPTLRPGFLARFDESRLLAFLGERPGARIARAIDTRRDSNTLLADLSLDEQTRLNLFASIVDDPGRLPAALDSTLDQDLGAVLGWLIVHASEETWAALLDHCRFNARIPSLAPIDHAKINRLALAIHERDQDTVRARRTPSRQEKLLSMYADCWDTALATATPPELELRVLLYMESIDAGELDWDRLAARITPSQLERMLVVCAHANTSTAAFLRAITKQARLLEQTRNDERDLHRALALVSKHCSPAARRLNADVMILVETYAALIRSGLNTSDSLLVRQSIDDATRAVVRLVTSADARVASIATFGELVHGWDQDSSGWTPSGLREAHSSWSRDLEADGVRGALTHVQHDTVDGGLTLADRQGGGLSVTED